MNAKPKQKSNYLLSFLKLILVLWIIGTSGITLFNVLEDKAECISENGIISGILWCDKTSTNQYGITYTWFKNLSWPIKLFSLTAKNQNNIEFINDEINDKTKAVYQLYNCREVAHQIGNENEVKKLTLEIKKLRQSNLKINNDDNMLATNAIKSVVLLQEKFSIDLIKYYSKDCVFNKIINNLP